MTELSPRQSFLTVVADERTSFITQVVGQPQRPVHKPTVLLSLVVIWFPVFPHLVYVYEVHSGQRPVAHPLVCIISSVFVVKANPGVFTAVLSCTEPPHICSVVHRGQVHVVGSAVTLGIFPGFVFTNKAVILVMAHCEETHT